MLAQGDFKNTYTWMWNTVPGTAFGGTTAWTVLPSGSTTAICWPGDLRGRFVPKGAMDATPARWRGRRVDSVAVCGPPRHRRLLDGGTAYTVA